MTEINWRHGDEPDYSSDSDCPCGRPATTTVEVDWADGKRRYRYCVECAEDIVFTIEGAEVLP